MKKMVYNYIKTNSPVGSNQVATKLNISGKDALLLIEELMESGFLKMLPPVPLSPNNNSSCYYTITDKKYP